MFSTDFIFRQQENLVDNQKCQAGFRPLCNKILFQSCSLLTQMCFKSLHYQACDMITDKEGMPRIVGKSQMPKCPS